MHGRTLSWGYIRDDDSKRNFLRDSTLMWKKNIGTISETAGKYPQDIYAVVACAIQLEWIFLQHVICYIGDAFAVVGKMIREIFLTCLFFVRQNPSNPK